ncbi:MAG: PAS domain S-box protein, partial [Gemmatimonadetes bacterium]|nr:PAS domain S-box protein [Gemmatimonadota bacterium]
ASVAEAEKPDTAVLIVGRGSSDPDANSDVAKIARLFYEGRPYPQVESAFVSMTPPGVEEGLDRLTRLAARALRAPVAFLSLVDQGRQSVRKFEAVGASISEQRDLPLDRYLCDEVIALDGPLAISDLSVDGRLGAASLLGGAAVAVLAIPLRLESGVSTGIIGVVDSRARAWEREEIEILDEVADAAAGEIRALSAGVRNTSQALRQNEDRFRSLIENAADVVSVISAGGMIDYATPSVERVLGYSPAAIAGQNAFALLHPSDAPVVIGQFSRLVRGAECAGPTECRIRHKDGTWRNLEVRVKNLLDDAAVVGVVVNARDITDARQAKDTQRRLQAFLEATPDFVATFDPHGRALSVNAAFRRVAGVGSGDDLSTLTIADLFPPAVTELILHAGIPEATRSGLWSGETTLQTQEGEEIAISQVIIAHKSADGSLEYLSTLARDITARKRAEQEVARSVELLREAERIAHMGSWEWDISTGEILWSDEMYRLFGLEPSGGPITYERYIGLIHPDDRGAMQQTVERALSDHEPYAVDHRVIRPDGFVRHIHGRGHVVLDRRGEPTRVMGSGQDVTERRAAEEALRQSEKDYRGLFENSHDAIVIMAPEGEVVLDVNPRACEVYGIPRDEFIGSSMERVSQDVEAGREKVRRTMELGTSWTFEVVQRRSDGTPLWAEITAAVIDYKGQPAILSVGRDVSERHAAEDALRESQEQLVQAQKMEAVGRLAGGIAHDFNNLLTAIKGFTELLLLDFDERDPRHPFVTEIQGAANRAAALTRQLLAFSRKQVLQPRVLDLNASVTDIDKMLRRLLGEDIRLETVQEPALGRVKADPSQIEQVLVNLAVNARDAMPNGGRIVIHTRNTELTRELIPTHSDVGPGSYVCLAVSDNGAGMTPAVLARVFEPFYTTKEKGKGTGLGLSTVYGIVQQSGGFVEVESTVGQGTTFSVYLPRVLEEAERSSTDKVADKRPVTGIETVLLVEDEAAVRVLVRRVLDRNGYRVLEASSGPDALRLLETNTEPIHMLLTDVVMPGMSGRELADRLAPEYPQMSILYMSGYTDEAIVHHGVLDPGIALIEKPFTPEVLLRQVREILDAAPVGPGR